MLINIGEEYVVSTEMTEDGPICHVTFLMSVEDFEYFSKHLCLPTPNISEGTGDDE